MLEGTTAYDPKRTSRAKLVDCGPWGESHIFVERENRPRADRVSKVLQVGRCCARRVDVEVLLAPGIEHVMFGVRRFDNDQIEVRRIEAVGTTSAMAEQRIGISLCRNPPKDRRPLSSM
jgi:hypothetical protein